MQDVSIRLHVVRLGRNRLQVVLPLMHAYFVSHRGYFLAGSASGGGNASDREKEMLARLGVALDVNTFNE
jgi:hypothetical protein